jgi:magnesium chelatase family protein
MLPCVLAAARAGLTRVVVPAANAREAALVPGITVRATDTLRRLLDFVRGSDGMLELPDGPDPVPPAGPDLADVVGQELGRRGLELAAAGGHHLSMIGPPGAGKTMLAQRLPSILPPLADPAALEVTAVHSIAGALPPDAPMIRRPPFQAPHHTASVAALIGGGSGLARPGAISLAHLGVLFMDEAPEFGTPALETLRQPLENGYVVLSRTQGNTRYPARIQLVLAANPCPCARPGGDSFCECSPVARRRYLGRLSGPLMDRVDLQIKLLPVTAAQLTLDGAAAESSAVVGARVAAARDIAAERWASAGWRTNAQVPGPELRRLPWRLPGPATAELRRALDAGSISARGYDRVLRLAWTVADLDGGASPGPGDVAEALAMRMGWQG